MLRRSLHILLLGFSLLFAQQAAATHALSHLGNVAGHTHQDKKSTNAEQCAKCLAFSQLDASCNSPSPDLTLLPRAQASFSLIVANHNSRFHADYLSRAPPYFV